MLAICPNNSTHKRFITVAHVSQDWEVDEQGNWIKTVDSSVETTASPHPDNIWTCAICDAEATVKE